MGFMGVGKGSIARELAKATGRFSIDTDDLIVSLENRKVKKIFKESGEAYFRELEQKCANWIESSVDGTIISIGGGFYKVKNLKNLGKIVYLKASFEHILDKILNSENAQKKLKKRPLFNNPKDAKELYNSRLECYERFADYRVDVEQNSKEEVLEQLLKIVD